MNNVFDTKIRTTGLIYGIFVGLTLLILTREYMIIREVVMFIMVHNVFLYWRIRQYKGSDLFIVDGVLHVRGYYTIKTHVLHELSGFVLQDKKPDGTHRTIVAKAMINDQPLTITIVRDNYDKSVDELYEILLKHIG